MWKLLPIVLLASCAATNPTEQDSSQPEADRFRIVDTREVPLGAISRIPSGPGFSRNFNAGDTRGSVRSDGTWELRHTVTHTRLRCAAYETGLQLGTGDQACAQVKWFNEIQYGSEQTHCNNATLIHRAEGRFEYLEGIFEDSNCVRAVTRCSGPC